MSAVGSSIRAPPKLAAAHPPRLAKIFPGAFRSRRRPLRTFLPMVDCQGKVHFYTTADALEWAAGDAKKLWKGLHVAKDLEKGDRKKCKHTKGLRIQDPNAEIADNALFALVSMRRRHLIPKLEEIKNATQPGKGAKKLHLAIEALSKGDSKIFNPYFRE